MRVDLRARLLLSLSLYYTPAPLNVARRRRRRRRRGGTTTTTGSRRRMDGPCDERKNEKLHYYMLLYSRGGGGRDMCALRNILRKGFFRVGARFLSLESNPTTSLFGISKWANLTLLLLLLLLHARFSGFSPPLFYPSGRSCCLDLSLFLLVLPGPRLTQPTKRGPLTNNSSASLNLTWRKAGRRGKKKR